MLHEIEGGELPGAKVFYRDRPLRELHALIYHAYEYLYRRMLVKVREYVEKEITLGGLFKADGYDSTAPPRLLTPTQLEALRAIIRDHHEAFIAGTISPTSVPPEVLQRFIEAGLVPQDLAFITQPLSPKDLPPSTATMIEDAFKYGALIGTVSLPHQKRTIEGQSYHEWKAPPRPVDIGPLTDLQNWQQQAPAPLSPAEKHAMDFASHSAASRIRGLGNRVAEDFTTRAIEGDKQLRRQFEHVIRDQVAESIGKRDTWRKLWSELGHASGDWSRDLGRIAATESMDAMIEGQSRAIMERSEGGPDEVRVAKQPNPDACKDCIGHYTVGGGVPRIFTMEEITANGSNIGRKRAEWKPTLGPIHPWCACELIEVPSGWEFDAEGDLIPSMLKRSDFNWNLRKSILARRRVVHYGDAVGDVGIGVRIGDPLVREAAEEVVSRTPSSLFTRATGVTLIVSDHGRMGNALEDGDYAYWTGNEIRIQHNIPPKKVKRVLEHEIGHSLNSWLLTTLGDIEKVKAWHQKLWEISKVEGYVTDYAKREPIENAAEVTRLYLYYRDRLRKKPRQFAFCHSAYKGAMG